MLGAVWACIFGELPSRVDFAFELAQERAGPVALNAQLRTGASSWPVGWRPPLGPARMLQAIPV